MRRDAPATRQRILAEAYRLFYELGFARASMDEVASRAGVTKKTLYYHFQSKDALVGAVLDQQSERALELVTVWLDDPSPDPVDMVSILFRRVVDWTRSPHFLASGFTRMAMELADLPGHPARVAARGHKRAMEEALTARVARTGVDEPARLARQLVVLIEGAAALCLIHGTDAYARAAGDAARLLARSFVGEASSASRPEPAASEGR